MKTFEETVRAMTGKEIVMAMVNGLKKEHLKVDMDTFGLFYEGICYGCAATNAICEISGVVFTPDNIYATGCKANAVGSDSLFLSYFEDAIDFLRLGNIGFYNDIAEELGIATLSEPENILPRLETGNWRENLCYYEEYAKTFKP